MNPIYFNSLHKIHKRRLAQRLGVRLHRYKPDLTDILKHSSVASDETINFRCKTTQLGLNCLLFSRLHHSVPFQAWHMLPQ